MSRRTERLALTGTLILAAVLRLAGLGWGLNHAPLRDEQDFVENVGEMIAHHDWNHRFYEYPGLFFDVLRPVLALAPPSPPYHSPWPKTRPLTHFGWTGYWAARAVVALAGVASVLLCFLLGRVLLCAEGGLVAALLVAVSPVEVFVSHEVRPDVMLETFVLLSLLFFCRLGERLRDDVASGLAIGAAAAVKLTGILIIPPYLLARALARGRLIRGALVALGSAVVLWLATTPYAALRPGDFFYGIAYQVRWHYRGKSVQAPFGQTLAFYLMTFVWSLGPVAAGLAVVGLLSLRGRLRAFAPALLYLSLLVLTLSTASIHWHRLALSGVGVATLLASLGFETLRRRWARPAWAIAILAALIPLYWSASYLRTVLGPGTRDRALAFMADHLKPGARVLNTVDELGIDRARFEVVKPPDSPALERLVALESDAVVWQWPDRGVVAGFDVLFRAKPRLAPGALGQRPEIALKSLANPIIVFSAPSALRRVYHDVPLRRAALSASTPADTGLAIDGKLETRWSTRKRQRRGDFFQVVLDSPLRLGRVDLMLGDLKQLYARALSLQVTDDGVAFRDVPFASARPAVEEQGDRGGASQVLVFEAVLTRGVRLSILRDDEKAWSIAEIHLLSVEEEEGTRGAH